MSRIAIVGCGTIGSFLAENVVKDADLELVGVVEPDREKARPYGDVVVGSIAELKQVEPDVVIEAVNSDLVKQIAPGVLEFADMMVMSGTCFADAEFERKISSLCCEYGRQIFIPHGAVLGLDGIQDGKSMLTSVHIVTTKKPGSLGRDDEKRSVVYDGPTRDVCSMYPRNVNVHAATAMAGLGFDRTRSTIISDPDAEGNNHVIHVEGDGFKFTIEAGSVTKSKVTGAYTLISAFSSLKRLVGQGNGIVIV